MDDLDIIAPADEPVITLTRTFDAPLRLVWKAISEPEHLVRWWGPHGHKNRVLQFDWRVGGGWKIESTTPDGRVIVFYGAYRGSEPPRRTVQTFAVVGLFDDAYTVETLTLTEIDGRTRYHSVSRFTDMAGRDGMIASGREGGVREGFERLDTMLKEWKQD
jgi:uncharacterized protein YndB with AHSA1/START domain